MILSVEKLALGGEGIAFSDGRIVFVPFGLPGEKVACRVSATSKDYIRADILDIIEPSPFRVKPPCPLFGVCGGCNLQHADYGRQLELKKAAAAEAFQRIAKFEPPPVTIRSGADYGYRNRVQLHFSDDRGIGFMKSASDSAVKALGCPIAAPVVDRWLRRSNRPANPQKALQTRIGARDRFVVFGQDERLYVEGADARALAVVAGREYHFPLRHFFQSNLGMAAMLVEDAIEGLSGQRAADLYCGAGLFAARLAERFAEVVCVESDAVSLEAARGNLPGGAGRFVAADVEAWARGEAAKSRRGAQARFDCVVADPPRSGLSEATREWLKSAAPGLFVYVSCDCATMARDIGDLKRSGWNLQSLTLYDFYPQTGHIEALARLSPPEATEH